MKDFSLVRSCLSNGRSRALPPSPASPHLRRHSSWIPVPPKLIGRQHRLVKTGVTLTGVLALAYPFASASAPPHAVATDADVDVDPLSRLQPQALTSRTEHLQGLGFKDLCRLYVVYLGSSQDVLVAHAPAMLKRLEWVRDEVPVVGGLVWAGFELVVGNTFYKVFCGGPTVVECSSLINSLAGQGVGCMLNYSAEASEATASQGVVASHFAEAVAAIRTASTYQSTTPAQGVNLSPVMLSMKLTGVLADPQLLARATLALQGSSAYERGAPLPPGVVIPSSPDLSDEDHVTLDRLLDSLRDLAAEAVQGGVRLLIDAEQSWYQPAIDRFVEILSEEFNKPRAGRSVPTVYNTCTFAITQ
ncbi:hypothetical protein RQP46_005423 [Phenoliferia psychrophenolica]